MSESFEILHAFLGKIRNFKLVFRVLVTSDFRSVSDLQLLAYFLMSSTLSVFFKKHYRFRFNNFYSNAPLIFKKSADKIAKSSKFVNWFP